MTKRLELFLKQFVRLLDMAVVAVSFLVAYLIRKNLPAFYHYDLIPADVFNPNMAPLLSYGWLLLVIFPVWLGQLHVLGAYRELRVKTFKKMVGIIFIANVMGTIFLSSTIFILKFDYISRSFLAIFFWLSFIALSIERGLLIRSWRKLSQTDLFKKNVLIVGTGPRARNTICSIQAHKEWGLKLVGIVDHDPELVGRSIEDVQVIGVLNNIHDILKAHVIDEVLFVVPRNWMDSIEDAILECENVGVKATVAVDLFNIRFAKSIPSDMQGTPLITFDTTPSDHWQLAIKTLGDRIASAILILMLSPILLGTAILVKLTSKGPILFKQIRIGLNGRQFAMYKFRSMQLDAEEKLEELRHLNEMTGPVFKLEKDPRLTSLGYWIRKTSIDELPQLFNVLKGDMSIVGPRPPVPKEVSEYKQWHRRRLSMRPGITGNWQVNGRNRVTCFDTWMRLDLEYIDRWSLFFDMKILLKTIPVVLLGHGAK